MVNSLPVKAGESSFNLLALFPRAATFLVVLSLLLLISACGRSPTSQQHQLYVFGTIVDITLWDVTDQQSQQAASLITTDFQRMHHEWHAWEPGPLMDINRAIAEGESVSIIPSLIPIIEHSTTLYHSSEGLFNPAIGRLLNLWGFQSSERPHRPPPSAAEIEALITAAPGMGDVSLKDGVLVSSNPVVQFDFGAFAKGYAIDLAIARLRSLGIVNAIVNGGGDLRAIGRKGERPWRVGVRHPQGEGVLASIEIEGDESVFTSGNYERFNEYEGVKYNHILDPRSGWPVTGITSATVIHDNGAVADAAATAMVVAGAGEWHRIAKKMGIQYVMLVDEAGVVYMNPAMQKRVRFQPGTEPEIMISEVL